MDFKDRAFSYLLKIRSSYLLLISLGLTIFLVEIVVAPLCVFFHGRVTPDFMITGFVTAALVGTLVFSLFIMLLERLRESGRALADSEGHLSSITSVLGEGVYVVSAEGLLTFMNPEAERILGWQASELLGRNFHDTVHFQCADGWKVFQSECPIHKLVQAARPCRIDEETFTRKDGVMVPVSIVATPIIQGGAVVASVAAFSDISESKRTKDALKRQLRFLETLLSTIPVAVFYKDSEGRYLGCNEEFSRVMGVTSAEVAGKTVFDLWPGELSRTYHQHDMELLKNPAHQVYDFKVNSHSGETLDVVYNKNVFMDENGRVGGIIGTFMDITERKRAQDSLQYVNRILERQATTDVLTGVCNRLKFSEVLLSEISRARRYGTPLSLIMLDIDRFKAVNDTYGHQIGDSVLRELARLVSANKRLPDTFARWGGEEFMLLAPDTPRQGALVMAGKLCALIGESEFEGAGRVTCSFGVAEFGPGDSLESFTNRADETLYRAKTNGRNRVEADTREASS